LRGAPREDALIAKWYSPDGTLYREDTKRGLIYFETILGRGVPKLMFELPIAGTEAENKTGLWKLEIYYKEKLVYEKYFFIM